MKRSKSRHLIKEGISLSSEEGNLEGKIVSLMREAHTLKGSARMVGLKDFGDVAHAMKDIFAEIKRGDLKPSQRVKDLLLSGTETLKKNLSGKDETGVSQFIQRVKNFPESEEDIDTKVKK